MAKKKKKLARPAKGNYIKVQAKFPIQLVDAIEKAPYYKSMNEWLKVASEERLNSFGAKNGI